METKLRSLARKNKLARRAKIAEARRLNEPKKMGPTIKGMPTRKNPLTAEQIQKRKYAAYEKEVKIKAREEARKRIETLRQNMKLSKNKNFDSLQDNADPTSEEGKMFLATGSSEGVEVLVDDMGITK
jgi:hypothetical protein